MSADASSTISRERLNQIAGRKLATLSIIVQLGQDRETLEGEFVFKTARVLYPGTEQPLPKSRFVVRGHDRMRFLGPPLAPLGEIQFYDLDRPAALEERVALALRKRVTDLEPMAAALRALKLQPRLDPQNLGLKVVVKCTQHAFELLAVPRVLRVARVEPLGGKAFDVPLEFPPLQLADFPTSTDLELYLSTEVGKMQKAPEPKPAAPAPPAAEPTVEVLSSPTGTLTLSMLAQKFGADAALSPSATVEVVQGFRVGGTLYRFVASRDQGTLFHGRLTGPTGDLWAEKFDLTKFPGTPRLVAAVIRGGSPPPGAASSSGAADDSGSTPYTPQAGEIWVMNVLIEGDATEEVRYVCVDTEGKPYGAARVLKRADFEGVFHKQGSGWRLLIQIDAVMGDSVIYRQLDAKRDPRGQAKRLATGILSSTFLPESAAY